MADALMILTDQFREIITEQFQSNPEFYEVEDEAIEDFARDAADEAISNIRWHLALGECLRLESIATESQISRSELELRISEGELLALEGRYDTFLPIWQFRDARAPLLEEAAREVLEIFRTTLGQCYRPENVISWACTAQPELDDHEPRQVIANPTMRDGIRRSALIAARGLAT
ncbi:hypothetical protein [Streptomyces sp. NPDC058548]|uniref:hypothetical protein n=1 Tax=Streptomyces sp. NPDC058548 TaxID=3346545 RepID=UPI00365F35F3